MSTKSGSTYIGRAMEMVRRATTLGLLFSFVAAPALGQTAGMLSFQGLIKDSMGNPVNGPVDLEFRIFDAETLGSPVDMNGDGIVDALDRTVVLDVTVTVGIVSTKFGPVHPSAFDGNERWLEVSVDGSPLSRIEMVTAPATAEQVNIPSTGIPAIHVHPTGNVGIATTNPQEELHVAQTFGNVALRLGDFGLGDWDLVRSVGNVFASGSFGIKRSDVGTPSLVVDFTGDVGIGTTDPTRRVHIVGADPVNGTGTITGTGTTTARGTTLVTGTGTAFTSKLQVGDTLIVGSQKRCVLSIASDTELTINAMFTPSVTNSPYMFEQAAARFGDSDDNAAVTVKSLGIVFPDATLQTTGIPSPCDDGQVVKWNNIEMIWVCADDDFGGIGGNTLDRAYDQGGPGAGRTITADSGPVAITAPSGTEAMRVQNTGAGGDAITALAGGAPPLAAAGRAICAAGTPAVAGETILADSQGAGAAIVARHIALPVGDAFVALNGGEIALTPAGRAICAVAKPGATGATIGADSGGAGPAMFARHTTGGDALLARSGGPAPPAPAGRAILATAKTDAETMLVQNKGDGDAITAFASGGAVPPGGGNGRAVWADARAEETMRVQNTDPGLIGDAITVLASGGVPFAPAGRAICAVANPPANGETIGADSGGAGPAIVARHTAAGDALVALSGGVGTLPPAGRAICAASDPGATSETILAESIGSGPAIRAQGGVGTNVVLDVVGRAQMTEFKMPTNAGADLVLTSDPAGEGTWKPLPPGGGGGNTLDQAYDQNGQGAGRSITANSGAVAVTVPATAANSAIEALSDGTGRTMDARTTNENNFSSTIFAGTNGKGPAIQAADTSDASDPGVITPATPLIWAKVADAGSRRTVVFARSAGLGRAGDFLITNSANVRPAIEAVTSGTGPGVKGQSNSGMGVQGESLSSDPINAGVRAIGNGCNGAAALNIHNGGITVSASSSTIDKPAGKITVRAPTSPLNSSVAGANCFGKVCDGHFHRMGFFDDWIVSNCLVRNDSIILLTVQADVSEFTPLSYTAQVISKSMVGGGFTMRVTAIGMTLFDLPPSGTVEVSYLIINPV